MKTSLPKFSRVTRRRLQLGLLLMECVVYIGMFGLISAIAFKVFFTCWDNSKAFRGNGDDIVETLKAGERWRADVRAAAGMPRTEVSPEGTTLRIPRKSGEVDYRFSENAVWRRDGSSEWIPLLSKIKSSRMEADPRNQITAWRWQLELGARRKGATVIPDFTFEAVPQTPKSP
jgi:hypothetical protein